MTSDLFTVQAEDPIEMVANLMIWERIRHVPVEDSEHALVGVVTHRAVMRFIMSGRSPRRTAVSEIMKTDVFTVTPETPTIEALRMMRRLGVGCLPVVHEGKLVGLVTDEDFMDLAAKLLEDQIGSGEQLSLILERDGRVPDTATNSDAKAEGNGEPKTAKSDSDSDGDGAPASDTQNVTPRPS
jgi:signal-transduction protein with cAMP-binding, CBS, and nucleotidyltransferase domain